MNETKKGKKHKRNKKKNEQEQYEAAQGEEQQQAEEVNTANFEDEELRSGEEFRKMEHTEEDSDTEDKPKKKKKKKKPVIAPTEGEKKGKKSIRQMKREKHALRQAEAQAASKDQLKSQCLAYLSQWKHDKQNWKFMKAKQLWLFKNKFSESLVPNASWPILLEYFESAMGNIRNLLLEDANKVIKLKDDWLEAQTGKENKNSDDEDDAEESETTGPKKPDETSYKRARDLIQCLQE